ncbi:PhoH family protein [Marinilabilia salmonicolor]|jgi:phosphate starvation-inducible PhoH-like protein|uniref:PhoH-like protein n=1 Tax=Marinilabilia salmonicolor TaxID=989 RepID=A0A2T0XM13_9BACT|nr:PhoH family protein [Marinilabilia salmonicolor]PRY99963.1 phosphate starvation-inducible protein PhoH [Marinilabilia salmonicolor]RCW38573.1 phosphate starvation-inducible PhoH-like protein [Marinilabilia salmonicolor]
MIEKLIYLESVDLVEFMGVKNAKLDLIKANFPKLKIVARGNWLKAMGDAEEVADFEEKINQLLEHYERFNVLKEDVINDIMKGHTVVQQESAEDTILFGVNGKPIKARTENQRKLVEAYSKNDLMFAVGPAGSGKTYTAIALAVKALKSRVVRRIILSRPAVEAGEKLGFLPGDMKEKIDPYLQPLYDALQDMIPAVKLKEYMENGTIQIAPLAYMRGRTLNNAFVILDEAQNTTTNQLKMFLTRMGTSAKFVVTGDITQIDLPNPMTSGLVQAMRILKGIKGIERVKFSVKDIVRHRLVQDIVEAYEKE